MNNTDHLMPEKETLASAPFIPPGCAEAIPQFRWISPGGHKYARFETQVALRLLLNPGFYRALIVGLLLLVMVPAIRLWLAVKARLGRWSRF